MPVLAFAVVRLPPVDVASVSPCRAAGRRWGAGVLSALQNPAKTGTRHQSKELQRGRLLFLSSRKCATRHHDKKPGTTDEKNPRRAKSLKFLLNTPVNVHQK